MYIDLVYRIVLYSNFINLLNIFSNISDLNSTNKNRLIKQAYQNMLIKTNSHRITFCKIDPQVSLDAKKTSEE